MNKFIYESPEISIVKLLDADIITTSNDIGGGTGGSDDVLDW